MSFVAPLALLILFAFPHPAGAQDASFMDDVVRGEVLEVLSSRTEEVPATGLTTTTQILSVRLNEGPRKGAIITAENTGPTTFAPADVLYVHRLELPNGEELWSAGELDRSPVLLWLSVAFVLSTVVVGGFAGVRALISLAGSFAIIVFVLVPTLTAGWPPVPTSVALALLMLVVSMFITHGLNRPTLVALLGSLTALALAAFIAELAVVAAKLSGSPPTRRFSLTLHQEARLTSPASS